MSKLVLCITKNGCSVNSPFELLEHNDNSSSFLSELTSGDIVTSLSPVPASFEGAYDFGATHTDAEGYLLFPKDSGLCCQEMGWKWKSSFGDTWCLCMFCSSSPTRFI